jgi:hypothetical protein
MTGWLPAAVLPNSNLNAAIEGDGIALVSAVDPRIQNSHPNFREFLKRFTDAFGRPLQPASLIVSDEVVAKTTDVEACEDFAMRSF